MRQGKLPLRRRSALSFPVRSEPAVRDWIRDWIRDWMEKSIGREKTPEK